MIKMKESKDYYTEQNKILSGLIFGLNASVAAFEEAYKEEADQREKQALGIVYQTLKLSYEVCLLCNKYTYAHPQLIKLLIMPIYLVAGSRQRVFDEMFEACTKILMSLKEDKDG